MTRRCPVSPPHSPPPRQSPQMRRLITCKWTRRRRRRCRAPCRSGLMCGSPRSLPRARSSSACGRQRNRQMSCWFSPAAAPLGCQIHLGWISKTCLWRGGVSLFFSLKTKLNFRGRLGGYCLPVIKTNYVRWLGLCFSCWMHLSRNLDLAIPGFTLHIFCLQLLKPPCMC